MIRPPVTYAVLPRVKDILINDDVLADDMYSPFGGIVVADGDQLEIDNEDPLEQPEPAANGFWWRIVLMRVFNGLQAPLQYDDNVRSFRFRVRIDVNPPDDSLQVEKFLEVRHNRCYGALHLKRLNVDGELNVCRRNEYPTPAFRDDSKGFRYSTAEYFMGLGPNN